MFGPLLWIVNIAISVVVGLVLVFGLGASLVLIGIFFAAFFLALSYMLACPICICHRRVYCLAVINSFAGKGIDSFSIAAASDEDKDTEDGVELTVRSTRDQDNFGDEDNDEEDDEDSFELSAINTTTIVYCLCCFPCALFVVVRKVRAWLLRGEAGSDKSALRLLCCGGFTKQEFVSALKDSTQLKKLSMVISILNPLLMVVLVGSWYYFEPVFVALWDYIELFAQVVSDWDLLTAYLSDIMTLSISWKALIDFAMSFQELKWSILLLRTILHVLVGVLDVIVH